jgi:murein DD-endopeptidase MepM/ murein hydrolase activator NlpD
MISPRTGLKKQGFGTYVVVGHPDASTSLYAHLDPVSVARLKPGQMVKEGDKLGLSDSSGAVTGPHLHFEFSPSGQPLNNKAKIDPNPCVSRRGEVSISTAFYDAEAIFQVFVGKNLLGENPPGKPARFEVSLRPGKYTIRAMAKQIKKYKKAYIYAELDEVMTILDSDGADLGPGFDEELGQGESVENILLVR